MTFLPNQSSLEQIVVESGLGLVSWCDVDVDIFSVDASAVAVSLDSNSVVVVIVVDDDVTDNADGTLSLPG